LGPLGTTATNRPIMPAPGDFDDGEIGGMMIGKGNRSTRRKPAPLPICPPQTPYACPDANLGRCGGKPATNRLSYGMAKLPRLKFFLIGIVGGGVQLGPLGTVATNRPIMPAPGDYGDGEIGGMIGKGN
jgi:hypothetical protein